MKGYEKHRDYVWQQPVVYFFEAVGKGLTKIGYSADPVKRFRHIQTSCPFPIRAVLLANGGRDVERSFHEDYADYRQHGEWFALPEQELDWLTTQRQCFWAVWHAFVRNVTQVRPAARREFRFAEFEAMSKYEVEFNNPLERSLL